MNDQLLTQWLDGSLAPAQRREVSRWLVRTADPRVAALLRGVLRDRRRAAIDARLRRDHPERSWLIEAWDRLVDRGHAAVSVGAEQAPVLAFARTPRPEPRLWLTQQDGALEVHAGPTGTAWALFCSDDLGVLERLPLRAHEDHLRAEVPVSEADQAVFWWCQDRGGAPEDALRRAVDDPLGEVRALRYEADTPA